MDYADIRRLVKLVETSNISEIEVEEGASKLRIVKRAEQTLSPSFGSMLPPPQYTYAPPPVAIPVGAPAAGAQPMSTDSKKMHEVLSPMVGTFYKAPSPEAPPYVQLGDMVRPGQVLCIIEAMKLMNEIEAEISGRIVEILPQNAQAVEFGQLLIKIDPA
jgi:acetyl-CoA carboxylase biotin carboxyl carrier protein